MKPIWVFIHWSESGKFKENSLMYFPDFESRCRDIARQHGKGNGYLKTKVEILFDDGSQYGCRIDLAEDDDHGFRNRAESTIEFYRTRNDGGEMIEFLNQITW